MKQSRTMNEKEYVSYNLAKALMDAGFEGWTERVYVHTRCPLYHVNIYTYHTDKVFRGWARPKSLVTRAVVENAGLHGRKYVAAPTLRQVREWLWKRGLYVSTEPDFTGGISITGRLFSIRRRCEIYSCSAEQDDIAIEMCIRYALEHLDDRTQKQ